MAWQKRGLIYAPQGDQPWSRSHAQLPTVDIVDDHVWRIYSASRDSENRSHVSFIDVEAGNPTSVIRESAGPILEPGDRGTFDDSGVMPSWIVRQGNVKYLYYIGWTLRQAVPYHNSVGLAASMDGGESFQRVSKGPVLGTGPEEPYFTGTSCVLLENGVWRNWYQSGLGWEVVDDRPEPLYHLRYAESDDGIHWNRRGEPAIGLIGQQGGITRASVLSTDSGYEMWYCYRNSRGYREDRSASYRIGYAKSVDGRVWRRIDDEAGIGVSSTGWDSEMIAYPHVVIHKDTKYMLYNGNGFGKSGFGYATQAV